MHVEARLVALTQPTINVPSASAEGLISYCARVSNPANQDNEDYKGLLSYCIRNKHWSVFEMANAIVEVEAPRDITRQLLRHRSFSFQEFSQRYSDDIKFTERDFRQQDNKNRQNSIDNLSEGIEDLCSHHAASIVSGVSFAYDEMISNGVAKECARVILPEGLKEDAIRAVFIVEKKDGSVYIGTNSTDRRDIVYDVYRLEQLCRQLINEAE